MKFSTRFRRLYPLKRVDFFCPLQKSKYFSRNKIMQPILIQPLMEAANSLCKSVIEKARATIVKGFIFAIKGSQAKPPNPLDDVNSRCDIIRNEFEAHHSTVSDSLNSLWQTVHDLAARRSKKTLSETTVEDRAREFESEHSQIQINAQISLGIESGDTLFAFHLLEFAKKKIGKDYARLRNKLFVFLGVPAMPAAIDEHEALLSELSQLLNIFAEGFANRERFGRDNSLIRLLEYKGQYERQFNSALAGGLGTAIPGGQ